jgi:hypothetical protein
MLRKRRSHAEQYDQLDEALKEMGTPFHSPEQFIRSQITDILYKYDEYKKNKQYGLINR